MESYKKTLNNFIRNDIQLSLYSLPNMNSDIVKQLAENNIHNMYQLYGKYLSFFDGNTESTRTEFRMWLSTVMKNNCSDINLLELCMYEKISTIFIEIQ